MKRGDYGTIAFASLLLAFVSCGFPENARKQTGFSQVVSQDLEGIFARTRNALAIEFPPSLADPTVWEGSEENVSTLAGQKTCGFARPDLLVWAGDDPEHCPRCESISHEYGHWLSFALYGDFDVDHYRFGVLWGEAYEYRFPWSVCEKTCHRECVGMTCTRRCVEE